MTYYTIKHKTKELWWTDSPKMAKYSWTACSMDFDNAQTNRDRRTMVNKLKKAPLTSQIEDGLNLLDFEVVSVNSKDHPRLAD